MRRFRFRLQRILDVRIQIRDQARQELVRYNAERDHQSSILAYLENEYAQLRVEEGGTYSASELMIRGAYAERLTIEIERQRVVVAKAIEEAERALDRYIEASRDAKALETLREKKLQEYQEQSLKEEGAMLDELAIQRANRNE